MFKYLWMIVFIPLYIGAWYFSIKNIIKGFKELKGKEGLKVREYEDTKFDELNLRCKIIYIVLYEIPDWCETFLSCHMMLIAVGLIFILIVSFAMFIFQL